MTHQPNPEPIFSNRRLTLPQYKDSTIRIYPQAKEQVFYGNKIQVATT